MQPVFTSKKMSSSFGVREIKLAIEPSVNQQYVVHYFKCGSCDADCVKFTSQHLFQRIVEH